LHFELLNTAIIYPCYLATNFIGAGEPVAPGHPLEPPLSATAVDIFAVFVVYKKPSCR